VLGLNNVLPVNFPSTIPHIACMEVHKVHTIAAGGGILHYCYYRSTAVPFDFNKVVGFVKLISSAITEKLLLAFKPLSYLPKNVSMPS